MILDTLDVTAARFEEETGWAIKPQGACRGEVCVPLDGGDRFDLESAADAEQAAIHKEVHPRPLRTLSEEEDSRAIA